MADINDLIAVGVKAPQVDDLATAQAKQLTLGNLATQSAMGKQQLASGAITLAQQQREQADEKAINDAMVQNTTTGPDGQPKLDKGGVVNSLNTSGRGIAASKVQAQFDAQDLARAKTIEAQNAAQTSILTLNSQRSTTAAQLAQAIKDAPPAEKPAAYQNFMTEGRRLGVVSPQDLASLPPQYDPSLDPHVDAYINAHTDRKTASDLKTADLNRQKDQAEIDKQTKAAADNWDQQALSVASTAQSQPELDAKRDWLISRGAPPHALAQIPPMWSQTSMSGLQRDALTPEQRTTADAAAATLAATKTRDANTEANRKATLGQGAQRNAIEVVKTDPFGALGLNKNAPAAGATSNLHGTELLGTLPPQMATRVQSIASGKETLTAREKGSPEGQALQAAVEQYDPAWSEQRAQLRKSFTTGPDGRNIGNLNTAPVHLAALADAATAMQNGSFVPGNQLYNSVSTMFGGTAPTNFDAMKTVVAGEMAAAMKGNATDPEIASFNKSVSDAATPTQLSGVIQKIFMPAIGTKLQTYNQRFHAENPDDPWTPVLPSARAAFSRFGIDPTAGPAAGPGRSGGAGVSALSPKGSVTVTDPSGMVHTFPSQAAADGFKKATGIK